MGALSGRADGSQEGTPQAPGPVKRDEPEEEPAIAAGGQPSPPRPAGGRQAVEQERRRFRTAVERQAARRERFRREGFRGFWFGLSSFGMVGWSIAVPTLLGVALGLWLDARFGGGIRYTLSFLIAGLVLGMTNVWRWIQLQAAEADADVSFEAGGKGAGEGAGEKFGDGDGAAGAGGADGPSRSGPAGGTAG